MLNIKTCLKTHRHCKATSLTLLALRIVVGVAFMYHGWMKIQNPFGWLPAQAPMQIPGFLQALAALSEFGGGLALVLGLLTPIACAGLAFTMLVAAYMHGVVLGDPFVSMTGGSSYELPLIFMAIAIHILVTGPGRFSADAKVFGEKS